MRRFTNWLLVIVLLRPTLTSGQDSLGIRISPQNISTGFIQNTSAGGNLESKTDKTLSSFKNRKKE